MSELKIQFKIVTPERLAYESEIDQVTLPIKGGQVTILPNHCSYIGALQPGEIMIKNGNEEIHLALSGGFVEFANNSLIVLADTAERAEEIDIARAEAARTRAEELKKQKLTMNELEYARVAAAIEKETSRLRVARKSHHNTHQIKID
ncbi:MAG: ATP synthase F1 subunit epsilon [bacterium]